MTALLVTPATPRLANGRGVRTYGVTAALSRHEPVEIAYVIFEGDRPAQEYGALAGVTTRPLRASRGARRALTYARARAGGAPSGVARGVSPELSRSASAAPAAVRVVADGPIAAAALLPLARRRDVVYLAHNLESGYRTLGRGDLAAFEQRVLTTFAEAWLPTRADVAAAQALGGAAVRARYVPNVVDAAAIDPVAAAGRATLLYVGDFTYAPNREGLEFLVGEVMPRVFALRPDARLSVAGRGLERGLTAADPRVTVLGFVDDLRGAYASADVVAVPLLHGGGSPLKFVDALAHGLPVVATEHAARLLDEGVAGEHFVAADSADAFAAEVAALLEQPERSAALGAAGRDLVLHRYSVDALAELLS